MQSVTKIIFKMQGFCKSGAQKSNKGNERIYRRISSAGWAETAGRVVMNKVSKLKGSEGFCFHWNTNELLTNLCITCPALPPVVSMYWHLFAIEPTRFWGERYALVATKTFSNLQKRHHLFPKNANQVMPGPYVFFWIKLWRIPWPILARLACTLQWTYWDLLQPLAIVVNLPPTSPYAPRVMCCSEMYLKPSAFK